MNKLTHSFFVFNVRKYFHIFFCFVMLCSLSNSFIFEFWNSPAIDAVELAESDGETEEEEVEFVEIEGSMEPMGLKKMPAYKCFHIQRSSAFIDISTPPPKFLFFKS
ncbi:MAG: hypothetical protein GY816_02760 [Cytophagales bacterium]|nr:hypothetical protein [Cytophagales bacterium]